MPASAQHLRKVWILTEKTISGMDRLRAGLHRRFDDQIPLQITFRSPGGPDANRLFRHRHMRRLPIRLAINSDRPNPHFVERTDHPAGNFPAVGDENFLKHSLLYPERGVLAEVEESSQEVSI